MTNNRLAKPAAPIFDRSTWTPQQHCEHANRQLIENGTNAYRRKEKLFPVKWIVVNDRLVMTEGEPQIALQVAYRAPDQLPNYPTKPVE